MLFYLQQFRVNFWYPMSGLKYTVVPAHCFHAGGAVLRLAQHTVHVAQFLKPAKVKRKGTATGPPHYQVQYTANGQLSRVSHPSFSNCDINISTAQSWSYDNFSLTYPVKQLPPKKGKHMQKQIVDGQECEVEVGRSCGRAEMPFQICSLNTCLPVILWLPLSLYSAFLIAWHPYSSCVNFNLIATSSYIPRSIVINN